MRLRFNRHFNGAFKTETSHGLTCNFFQCLKGNDPLNSTEKRESPQEAQTAFEKQYHGNNCYSINGRDVQRNVLV